jgi:signal peptidase II
MIGFIVLVSFLVCLDQVSKSIVRVFLSEGESKTLINNFLYLTFYKNDGAAFNFFKGKQSFLLIASAVIIVIMLILLWKFRNQGFIPKLAIGLILGGGIGNMIDRIMFQEVTDMIKVKFFPPVFNLADSFVVIGCILLCISVFRYKK